MDMNMVQPPASVQLSGLSGRWVTGVGGGRGEREQQVVCKESSSVFITLL